MRHVCKSKVKAACNLWKIQRCHPHPCRPSATCPSGPASHAQVRILQSLLLRSPKSETLILRLYDSLPGCAFFEKMSNGFPLFRTQFETFFRLEDFFVLVQREIDFGSVPGCKPCLKSSPKAQNSRILDPAENR